MDPSYISSEDEDADAAAMAAAMGFSSFGTQGPPKKRKFNANTDAVVDGDELAALDKGGKKGQGTGGNQIPLGRPRVIGVPSAPKQGNDEEIDLDDGDDDDEPNGGVPIGGDRLDDGEDDGPQYIDTSLPPPNAQAQAAQERIDAILSQVSIPLDGGSESAAPSIVGASPQVGNQRPRERGQRNELWYIDYYDPSFNENPWRRLEQANGLEPRGTWLEREGVR